MKKISNDLKKHATKIIMKKKVMMPLINKKYISHRKQNICYICQKKNKQTKKKQLIKISITLKNIAKFKIVVIILVNI